jgi:general L-amino acid transport system permease protein
MDLRGTLGGVTLNQTGKELESMLLMMLIYLTISLMISSVMNIYNSAVGLKER